MRLSFPGFLVALMLAPCVPQLILRSTMTAVAGITMQSVAYAEGPEATNSFAKMITVRIEGATQGSGALVKRTGNIYTVLTAWHVVSGQRAGDQLDIFTYDGERHQLIQGSIKHLGTVDLAVLTFANKKDYRVPIISTDDVVREGEFITIGGYPLGSNSAIIVSTGKVRVDSDLRTGFDNGYSLIYSNNTKEGMSGGPILKKDGSLVGIHGMGSRLNSIDNGIKQDNNAGIPIVYYKNPSYAQPKTNLDNLYTLLEKARTIEQSEGTELIVIKLTSQANSIRESDSGLLMRGHAKQRLKDYEGAILDYDRAIAINSNNFILYFNRGLSNKSLGRLQNACSDFRSSANLGETRYSEMLLSKYCQ